MGLVNVAAFLVLKIRHNFVTMQMTANISKIWRNTQAEITFTC